VARFPRSFVRKACRTPVPPYAKNRLDSSVRVTTLHLRIDPRRWVAPYDTPRARLDEAGGAEEAIPEGQASEGRIPEGQVDKGRVLLNSGRDASSLNVWPVRVDEVVRYGRCATPRLGRGAGACDGYRNNGYRNKNANGSMNETSMESVVSAAGLRGTRARECDYYFCNRQPCVAANRSGRISQL
jgi:hypothetical protein